MTNLSDGKRTQRPRQDSKSRRRLRELLNAGLPPEQCWPWPYKRNKDGYGQGYFRGKFLRAHRMAWEVTHGSVPVGMFVCHRCDNPPCVNQAHLFLGTNTDNMRDMAAKGRSAWQKRTDKRLPRVVKSKSRKPRSTEQTVREIRALRASGWSIRALGDFFGRDISSISRICSRRFYADVF